MAVHTDGHAEHLRDCPRLNFGQRHRVSTRLFEGALDSWPEEDRRTLATLVQRLTADLAAAPNESTPPIRQSV